MIKIRLEAGKVIPLEIPKDYYVLVQLTTMAAFKFIVTLRDKNTLREYIKLERKSTDPLPPKYEFTKCRVDESELYIDVPESSGLDIRMEKLELFNDNNELLNRTYVFLGEDSNDYDYNDICLTITILKKAN